MKLTELFDTCLDAVERFNKGEMFTDRPFVYLSVPRKDCPQGKTIRLFGRSGPLGDICNVKRDGDGFVVVAVFPAVPIIKALADEVGVKVRVRRTNKKRTAA